ncbi:MAG: valine--tRNA ligase [Sorangiineae bacterium]|nr:valine--tRNA ligase [Polyangiaceae bacterium]MEB2322871.1 valine--tRNA ligase [Sorangiineae bacterium]
MSDLPKAYEPRDVEPRWYAYWLEHGVFSASVAENDARERYVIPMPPPNVTGSLHMGHALYTLQDVLCRHARMQGKNVLWQPGIDHAGIATQTVVERQLMREGKTRHDLGRKAFVERVWSWKEQSGGRIAEQMRVLGFSADWERLKFTMDPDLSHAVRESFVRLYEEGLIYRDTRLINWCSDCRTALSDLEVENEPAEGELYEFAYPSSDGASELVVATTRPETMLGDTAVAVHPDDPRYRHLHGKTLRHPFLNREIPVITDAILVDMEFGTGAVKVTPAHDFNDFATGKRHGLEEINVLNPDGTINEQGGPFMNMTVAEARAAVKRALAEAGLERGSKPHALQLPRCQRTHTIVEPMVSTQWFVRTEPLAQPALEAVRDGRTKILPEEWVKTYEHWLTGIQDWCISRQLWWGHQIPAYYCPGGHITVGREAPEACATCGAESLTQDPDVLDTWFSSALWPFSTLGWPKQTVALERFYPSSDLETGYDILFFWVARMMMMGLHFMGDVPFRRVLLHGLIVDETGEKMSKVKGNTIDPLDLVQGASFDAVVEKALPGAPRAEALAKFKKAYPSVAQMGEGFPAFGADALRMTLCSYPPQSKRIALSPKRIEGYRNFCNKVYNAVRFALDYVTSVELDGAPPRPTLLVNRWILARLAHATEASSRGIDGFRMDDGSGALYRFFWDELCDWFLEATKPIFTGGTEAEKLETRQTLAHVIETSLRALHPFIPFITEELWQRVPRPASRPLSVALAPYPTAAADGRADPEAEAEMGALMRAIGAARAVRSEHGVPPNARVPLTLRASDAALRQLLEREQRTVEFLVRTDGAPLVESTGGERSKGFVMSVAGEVEVLVGLRGLVSAATEQDRIERGLKKTRKDVEVLDKRLANPKFVANAPDEVVREAREQLDALERQLARLEEARALVSELE